MIRTSWTRVASIEETLAFWATSLREIKKRIRPLFKQDRVAANAGLFLEGLLGDEQRKTGWMRAEAAGDPGPWRQQAVLGRSQWDAEALVAIVRDYVVASGRPLRVPRRDNWRLQFNGGMIAVVACSNSSPCTERQALVTVGTAPSTSAFR